MKQLTTTNTELRLTDVIKSTSPSLAKLNRENPEMTKRFIFLNIAKIFKFYAPYEPNQIQVTEFINFVLKEGYYLKEADFIIFTNNCINRTYIPKYKFDITDLQDWFLNYLDVRFDEAAKINSYSAKKEEPINKPLSEKGQQVLTELSEIFKGGKSTNNVNDPKSAYVSKICLQFNREAKREIEVEVIEGDKKYKVMKPCAPYMEYGGKILFINEYVAARFEDFYNEVTAEWSQIEGDKVSLDEYIKSKI